MIRFWSVGWFGFCRWIFVRFRVIWACVWCSAILTDCGLGITGVWSLIEKAGIWSDEGWVFHLMHVLRGCLLICVFECYVCWVFLPLSLLMVVWFMFTYCVDCCDLVVVRGRWPFRMWQVPLVQLLLTLTYCEGTGLGSNWWILFPTVVATKTI